MKESRMEETRMARAASKKHFASEFMTLTRKT